MSTASDISAYAHSVEPAQAETLFSSKKWTYIQDSTSNTSQYSGQIQFNLSTISSQASFVNWEEAVIELPVKLQITNASGGSITSTAAATFDQLVPKAGSWQFLDSVQVVIDATTVQTNQIHENVMAQFNALTEWSQDDLVNHGATTGFALDRYEPQTADALEKLDSVEKMIAVEMSECQSDVDAVYKRRREAKVEEITEQRELEAARSAVENLEQQLISVRDECDGQTQIALKLGRRPDEVNVPAQCNRQIKTVERQLTRVRDKLEAIRSMLNERVDNWTRFRKAISQHTSREFEKFMLLSNFARKLRFLYLYHRLEIVVRRNDSGVSSSRTESPFRIMDEFDVFMDSQNHSMTVELLVEAAKKNCNKQFIFVTPNDLSMLRPDPVVKIQKLAPPRYRAASAGAHDVDKDGVA
ncbi:hypothetical protein L917_14062 [Phytophthora nicotianae]|uniref:RecF/RecN/SMC N-terminal domain-containing protein n=1 Tax=Phytophthora nicotianae TaxID=4792 RepID=W2KN57_PHYNI|nr:hypothetical protein L917_14062 [Phytophthora nicotianae]